MLLLLAKQLCPEVVCAHVATIGPGDSQPDYYPSPSRYTHKVSLDPYRKASAKIFSVFRKYCTTSQKGGLDEVFMDVTDIVNQRIMDEYGKDLSRWDRANAEMIHWERDHPEAGVVFGLVKDDGSAALEVSLDDEDDYELGKEDREEDDELEGGQRHDEVERDEAELQDPTTQSGPTTATAMGEEVSEDDEFGFKDDDFDWEALAAIEEIEENLTQERLAASQSQVVHTQEQLPSSNDLNQPTALTAPEMTAEQIQQQQQEADEAREKAEQAERLRQEKVFLLPYYGVPEGTFEEQFWAEMQLLKAAEFCNEIRKAVKDELGYTCSAGISNNRLLAKLGSGMNKPYQQTIILPRYIPDLMHGVKLSKIRGLGGKFGHRVKTDFQIERASQLWPVPLRRLQERYSPQTGLDLWQWCRGIDPVGIRKIKSKSMCSHKSFIPALSDLEEIEYWIQTMCRELVSRMEAEYIETSRWPRTISLGFFGGIRADRERSESSGQGSAWAPPSKGSRQMAMGGRLDYGGVDGLTRKMFRAVEKLIQDGREGRIRPVLPLIILTVTASNFDAGGHSAKDIASFFTKSLQPLPTQSLPPVPSSTAGSEASGKGDSRSLSAEVQTELVSVPEDVREVAPTVRSSQPNIKGNNPSTSASASSARKRFFGGIKFSSSPSASSPSPSSSSIPCLISSDGQMKNPMSEDSAPPSSPGMECDGEEPRSAAAPVTDSPYASNPSMTVLCTQCPPPGQDIPASEWDEHQDYHFALSLHNDERQQHQQQQQQQQNHKRPQEASGSSTRGRRKKAKSSSSAGVGGNGSGADHQTRPSPASNGAADNSKLLTNFFKPSS
ncbi:DNA-directed DNA polymerase eta rad30 [Actinomortierella ambigua]|nr:DNA-directed DNA polymerase eta rad30 [Actinomortierella ambigua]